jgi:serine dehydrogenase proteinase
MLGFAMLSPTTLALPRLMQRSGLLSRPHLCKNAARINRMARKMKMAEPNDIESYANDNDCDLYAYVGGVGRPGYDQLCRVIPSKRRKNCLLVLATFGGDANAGYRIARALSHNYPEPGQIRVLVPHYCKSAGTLVCLGAHELIMADRGELGPLDIQVQKPDEMLQLASGLDIIRGLAYLSNESLNTFREYLLDINDGSGLSTSIASEIASKLTIGMYNPIFAQIDPLKLGEMQAALTIAVDYGSRLNERTKNLKSGAIQKLSMLYPSHGFVIDRKEVRELFNRVRPPIEGVEQELCVFFAQLFDQEYTRPRVFNLLAEFESGTVDTVGLREEGRDVEARVGGVGGTDEKACDDVGIESGVAKHGNTPDLEPSEGKHPGTASNEPKGLGDGCPG